MEKLLNEETKFWFSAETIRYRAWSVIQYGVEVELVYNESRVDEGSTR